MKRIVIGCDENGVFTIRTRLFSLMLALFLSLSMQAQTVPLQCSATTKDGARCHGVTQKGATFCYFHNPANRCTGTNAKGKPCGAMKANGTKFCRFHQSQAK